MNEEKEKQAGDYSPREVEAARRVMVELFQILGGFRDAMVIVGGWVPELLMPKADPPHTGSLDVDILLNPEPLRNQRYASIVKLLLAAGYKKTDQPFKLEKSIKVDTGNPVLVEVDFLIPKRARIGKNLKTLPDFRALDADGARFALRHSESVTRDGKMPDGRNNLIAMQVVSVEGFIVMKSFALGGRSNPKDAYDIYFCLKNHPLGVQGIAERLRPHTKDREVNKAISILASKFRDPKDYGPATVARFFGSPDTDLRAFQARDAFEQVSYLLRLLGWKEH